MALLEARDLTIGLKREGEFLKAVDNISFEIEAGEILGLAGESGCGKSLTALSIPGLLPRTAKVLSGETMFKLAQGTSVSLTALGEKELCSVRGKEISIIFQEARQCLNPLLRAGAQIAETLELHAFKGNKEKLALDMLARLGFTEPEKVYGAFPHQLSGGMCQRVMIAIAAICRPRLLIADEPTTALDEANQEQILSLLLEINREYGTAILFISHDLTFVQKFCHRVMVMYAGKIVEEGPAQSLLSSPLHPYTKGLIGAIPTREQKGRPLANIPGRIPSIWDTFPGCRFAPRCPAQLAAEHKLAQCIAAFPPARDLGNGHRVCCYLTEPAANSGNPQPNGGRND